MKTPNVSSIRTAGHRSVAVSWKGGAESLIDLSEFLARFKVFASLRSDDELFGQVSIGEWGWYIGWSDEMEISSDTLWRLAREQSGL